VASWRKYVDVVDNSEKVSKNIGLFPQIGGGAEGGEMDFTSPPHNHHTGHHITQLARLRN
jgi:hypothetical protein